MFHIISDKRKESIAGRLKEKLIFRGVVNTPEIIGIFLDELNKEVVISIGESFENEIKIPEVKEFEDLTPRQIKSREGRTEVVCNGNTISYRKRS